MTEQQINFKTKRELDEAILQDKAIGTPDLQIGQKYGVSFKYIERLITKTHGLNVSELKDTKKIKTLHPKDFKEQQTTVWSFKQRGNWATHSGEYRGNWSPYIPRNIILKYSKPGDIVLDYFCGGGTTAIECKLLGRRCIAIDINEKAIELAKRNTDFSLQPEQLSLTNEQKNLCIYEPTLKVGDARDLFFLDDDSIDLICAHPPYANIINYTNSKDGDLSFLDLDHFLNEMSKVAKESFRVLKPGRQCAILIGDMRKDKHVIPLGFQLINVYLDAGFKLRELVIKRQHNCKTTGFWYANSVKYNFLLLAHEYLPVFEKPVSGLPADKVEPNVNRPLVAPILKNLPVNRNVENLETTTVWELPEKSFEQELNKNIIYRYSDGERFSAISFNFHPTGESNDSENSNQENRQLLIIKSPFLDNNPSRLTIEYYLKEVEQIVKHNLSSITKGGFVVIQTQDLRIDGYIEPLAKRIVDKLTDDNLWLKEIVVLSYKDESLKPQSPDGFLKIAHKYLLIYEVMKSN
ncbi:MAG: DNA methyltransferase [Armatimonadota bacterium]|nr:DNA methyltransferase [Armatimonadota bacterium]